MHIVYPNSTEKNRRHHEQQAKQPHIATAKFRGERSKLRISISYPIVKELRSEKKRQPERKRRHPRNDREGTAKPIWNEHIDSLLPRVAHNCLRLAIMG
jgi:hypothetical protein